MHALTLWKPKAWLMGWMKAKVFDVHAPVQRMTKTAAVLLATVLSVPVFVVLSLIDWLWL